MAEGERKSRKGKGGRVIGSAKDVPSSGTRYAGLERGRGRRALEVKRWALVKQSPGRVDSLIRGIIR